MQECSRMKHVVEKNCLKLIVCSKHSKYITSTTTKYTSSNSCHLILGAGAAARCSVLGPSDLHLNPIFLLPPVQCLQVKGKALCLHAPVAVSVACSQRGSPPVAATPSSPCLSSAPPQAAPTGEGRSSGEGVPPHPVCSNAVLRRRPCLWRSVQVVHRRSLEFLHRCNSAVKPLHQW